MNPSDCRWAAKALEFAATLSEIHFRTGGRSLGLSHELLEDLPLLEGEHVELVGDLNNAIAPVLESWRKRVLGRIKGLACYHRGDRMFGPHSAARSAGGR